MTRNIHVCVLGEESTYPEQFIATLIDQDPLLVARYTRNAEYVSFIEKSDVSEMRLFKKYEFDEISPYVINQVLIPPISQLGDRDYTLKITYIPDPLFYEVSEAELLLEEIRADFFVQILNLNNYVLPSRHEKLVIRAIKQKKHIFALINYDRYSELSQNQYVSLSEYLQDENVTRIGSLSAPYDLDEFFDEFKHHIRR